MYLEITPVSGLLLCAVSAVSVFFGVYIGLSIQPRLLIEDPPNRHFFGKKIEVATTK